VADVPRVVALVKVVAAHVDVDAVTGVATSDERLLAVSPADEAAVGVAAALATHRGVDLEVVALGPAAAEGVLCDLAAGARADATLLSLPPGVASCASATTARLLADAIAGVHWVVCGDYSLDRGSGSVPARVAHHLGVPQVLGLLHVDVAAGTAIRRLSHGRREMVSWGDHVVLSVEASAGRAPRATVADLLTQTVVVRPVAVTADPPPAYEPYRVPARVTSAPTESVAAQRAVAVMGVLGPTRSREVLVAEPDAAAAAITDRLHAWGYR
jgi:electron transfer flavoprotein beta subunit